MSSSQNLWVFCFLATFCLYFAQGMVAFEKLTEYDYRGNVYYTIKNLTLYECQGWCREEPECQAATFSFVVNPLIPVQQTICLLQNETAANNPSATPQRAYNTYYMVKLRIRSDNVCQRPWTFERVPNKMIKGLDNALIFTSTKEACLAACLNEQRFVCRSAEYNYVTLQCHLSEYDRRSIEEFIEVVDTQGVDYFENLCLNSNEGCKGKREYEVPQMGIPETQVSRFVSVNYYVDKELMASNQVACERACQIENEFLCRSFLYKGPPDPSGYNCQLFHLDHVTLPDGTSTYLSPDRPLIDVGDRVGSYYENSCQKPTNHMICKQVVTRDKQDKAYITQIMCYEKPIPRQSDNEAIIVTTGGQSGPEPVIPSEANGSVGIGSQIGGAISTQTGSQTGGKLPGQGSGGYGSQISGGSIFGGSGLSTSENKQTNEIGNDVNCDNSGLCYDVSVHCKDTKIQVNVNTNKPFSGRIYALGRSETCNVDVIDSDAFRLDLTMTGQDCNTQSAAGIFTNTIVVQHHSVVMTRSDKIYKIRCTYDMTSKNITFGMMPISVGGEFHSSDQSQTGGYLRIRDPDMISITSAPEAPPPRIRILDSRKKEVETVRIGDKLTFRIEIPDNTPYGIFARSCVAMAKDSRSTFQIIDDEGCPVDPSIFPRFTPDGLALQSVYEAFRFTESYGVIFQCNVRYCLGPCEPATCQWGRENYESWGKRKRREASQSAEAVQDAEDMTLSQEILVLDFDEEKIDPFSSTRTGTESFGFSDDPISIATTCPTKTSVLALSVTCALLLLIYVCTVFYFLMKKYINPRKSLP